MLPAFSHVLRYGDRTAKGIAGGLAGVNVDLPITDDVRNSHIIMKRSDSMFDREDGTSLGNYLEWYDCERRTMYRIQVVIKMSTKE